METGSKREFKGVWCPANVWNDDRLNALDKFILLEIHRLDDGDGCAASNAQIARSCQCCPRKVSSSIVKLKQTGYVTATSEWRGRVLFADLEGSQNGMGQR